MWPCRRVQPARRNTGWFLLRGPAARAPAAGPAPLGARTQPALAALRALAGRRRLHARLPEAAPAHGSLASWRLRWRALCEAGVDCVQSARIAPAAKRCRMWIAIVACIAA